MSASPASICPICDQVIREAKGNVKGHEAIFCDGSCQVWLHRCCAGLSKSRYEALSGTVDPFLCPSCQSNCQQQSLDQLKAELNLLRSDFEELKDSVSTSQSTVNQSIPVISSSWANVVKDNPGASPNKNSTATSTKLPTSHKNESDRKSNVILYGIPECEPGTPRLDRYNLDLNEAISSLSSIMNSITRYSIRDCFRLGKYVPDQRPRPILVKMISAGDVRNLLARSGSFCHPLRLKPDLTPEDRKIEGVLLKERWSLIQKGVDKKSIKLRKNNLLVANKLHGSVKMGEFELSTTPQQVVAPKSLPAPSSPQNSPLRNVPSLANTIPPHADTIPPQSPQGLLSTGSQPSS